MTDLNALAAGIEADKTCAAIDNIEVQAGVETQSSESQAKATEGKAGMAGVTDPVRRSTAGTGLRVGEASADLPATSEFMDVTAGETATFPSEATPSQEPVGYGYSAEIQSAHGDLLHVCRKRVSLYDTPLYTHPTPARDGNTEALRLLAAEDERQSKLHELLETIREQIRLEVSPEHRPDGLFNNIQNAVYAMRGRTLLMNDAAITAALSTSAPAQQAVEPDRSEARERIANTIEQQLTLLDLGCGDEVNIRDCIAHFRQETSLDKAQALRDATTRSSELEDADRDHLAATRGMEKRLTARALAAESRLAEAMRVIERSNGLLGDAIICVRPFDPSKADAMLQAQDAARDFLNAAKEKT